MLLGAGTGLGAPWTLKWLEELTASTWSDDRSVVLRASIEALIPEGVSAPGALSVGVDAFIERLYEHCYTADVQEALYQRLSWVGGESHLRWGKAFDQCTLDQRLELLMAWAQAEEDEGRASFELLKSETIRGFRTSREVMTRYHRYRVAPGFYHGCVQVPTGEL